jgi:pimeloyl-ACP methyl ester carboxylesterase
MQVSDFTKYIPDSWPGRLVWPGLALAVFPAIIFYARTAWLAWRDLHPVRVPVDPAAAQRLGLTPVDFRADDGVRLKGWYRAPAHSAAVLLVHGHGANRMQMLDEAELLLGEGYGVLLFDLRAHGESGGRVATSGAHEQMDVSAALAALRSQPAMAGARIGAIGFSIGGIALAGAAASDQAVAALVLQAAAPTLAENYDADFPKDRPGERWTSRAVHEQTGKFRIADVRPIDHVPRLAQRPLLLVYGEHDPMFSRATRERMLQAAGHGASLWVVPGAGHGHYLDADRAGYVARVLPFLRRALLPDPAAPPLTHGSRRIRAS